LKAVEEADRQGHRGIGIVHLILGLLDETGSVGARLLTAAGVNAVAIRQDVERLQDESARST
jgi:ATP-dependent Clp protease ATP-binding subunit ClpA